MVGSFLKGPCCLHQREVNEAYQQVAFADKDPKSLDSFDRRHDFSQTKVWLCKTSELGCPDHPQQAGSGRLRRSDQSEGHFFFFLSR